MLTDRQTDGQKSIFFLYYIDIITSALPFAPLRNSIPVFNSNCERSEKIVFGFHDNQVL